MFARLLAILICLWVSGPRLGRAEPASQPGRELVVYLKTAPGQTSPPIAAMEHEADALMATAGYNISWRKLDRSTEDAAAASLAVLQLRGVCRIPEPFAPLDPLPTGTSLASTAVADGKVLPYSQLECGNLTRFLAPSLRKEAPGKRTFLYGRAMGRLVAHELFHVLIGTRGHDDAGVGKRSFSTQDILAEHFEFEPSALDKFRGSAPESLTATTQDFNSGARGR
jgi:hypothetical protein